jgi:hypothetical protein
VLASTDDDFAGAKINADEHWFDHYSARCDAAMQAIDMESHRRNTRNRQPQPKQRQATYTKGGGKRKRPIRGL